MYYALVKEIGGKKSAFSGFVTRNTKLTPTFNYLEGDEPARIILFPTRKAAEESFRDIQLYYTEGVRIVEINL